MVPERMSGYPLLPASPLLELMRLNDLQAMCPSEDPH